MANWYKWISKNAKQKKCLFAVLIDPDKFDPDILELANKYADVLFVGGSTLPKGLISKVIQKIKKKSPLPVFIFPGDETQIDKNADALLLLSLISGRNPDYLISKHVKAASAIKKSGLQVLPTGYILTSGNHISTTEKVSKTKPIDPNEIDLICRTALAAELLGMKLVYLEAGSGTKYSVPEKVIKKVRATVNVPLIVGGGIDSYKKVKAAKNAGADVIVVGNALEKDLNLIKELSLAFR